MDTVKAIQLLRSIGYTARPCQTPDYVVIEDGAEIHCIPLSLVQAWIRSH